MTEAPGLEGHLLRVGGMFAERDRWPEGPHLWLEEDQIRLAVFLTNPDPREIRDIESGEARFGWTEQGQTGYLLFKYGESPWNDTPFNPQRLSEPFDLQRMPKGTHQKVYTFLVHADTGIIAAMRLFTWPGYFINHIIDSVERLDAIPYAEPEAYAEQQEFYRRYPDGPSLYRLVQTLPRRAVCVGGQRDDQPPPPRKKGSR